MKYYSHFRLRLLIVLFLISTISIAQSPNWLWAKNAGGTGCNNATAIVVDSSGNTYVTGYFGSPSFTIGNITLKKKILAGDNTDIFIAKFDPDGNVLWAKSASGNRLYKTTSISLDNTGNIFISGIFDGNTLDFGSIVIKGTEAVESCFIAKYNSVGDVIWAKRALESGNEAKSITVDVFGNIYLTGNFWHTITFGSITLKSSSNQDIFIAKFDSNGNALWAKSDGEYWDDFATSIAVDKLGNVYITGGFNDDEFIFLNKYDSNGNILWKKNSGIAGVGGFGQSIAYGFGESVAVDKTGNIFLTGGVSSSITFDTIFLTNANKGYNNAFIVKFNTNGNAIWAKSSVGKGTDYSMSVGIDASGNAYTSGCFSSSNITFGSTVLNNADKTGNNDDIFIAKYDNTGNVLWAKSAGGSGNERTNSIAVLADGITYLAGYFYSTNINLESVILSKVVPGYYCSDLLIAKLDSVFECKINDGVDQAICFGQPAILYSSGATNYKWSTGDTIDTIIVSPTITTTYYVTGSKAGFSNIASIIVKVNPLPLTNAGANQTICFGKSTTLNATGASNYVWTNGDSTCSIKVSPTITSTYTVTGTSNGCTNISNVVVNVNPLPVTNAGADQTIYYSQSAVLNVSGATTYSWNTNDSTNNITVSPTTTTLYLVTGTTAGCTSTSSVFVKVNPLPVTNAGTDQTICIGQPAILYSSGATNYKWSTGDTIDAIVVTPTITTTYYVTGSKAGFSNIARVIVKVNPLPVTNAGTNQTICIGKSTILKAAGASNYIWATGDTTGNLIVTPEKTSTYTVTGTSMGCTSSSSVKITVNPSVSVYAGPDQTIYNGKSATLNASHATTYSWSTGVLTGSTTIFPTTTTTYTVTGTKEGCTTSDNVVVNIQPVLTNEFSIYPNPFNVSTNIEYSIVEEGNVEIVVYDLLGNFVTELVNETKANGYYNLEWHRNSLGSAVYLLKFKSNSEIIYKRIILIN